MSIPEARDQQVPWLKQRRFVVIAALVVACFIAAGWAIGLMVERSYDVSPENIREDIRSLGAWGHLMYVLVMIASVIFSPIPNLPVMIGGGLAYGVVLGTAYAVLGLTIGGSIAFWIARKGGRRYLARFIGPKAAAQIDAVASARTGGWVLFWARMLPLVTGDWVAYAAGLTGIRYRVFLLATAFGSIPPTAVAVGAGDQLDENWWITAIVVAVAVLAAAGSATFVILRQKRLREQAQELAERVIENRPLRAGADRS
jgi:uncharacterized membrane protein YdjX (TVP38/TMEM64 family)